MVHDLVAYGIEGGSKRAIEAEWSLTDVAAQRAAWRRNGPPLIVGMVHIAASLGVKLLPDEGTADGETETTELKPNAPTLAELAADLAMPVGGGDTTAASLAILQKLKAGE